MRKFGALVRRESRKTRSRYWSVRVAEGGRRTWVCTGQRTRKGARRQILMWEREDAEGARHDDADLDLAFSAWLALQEGSQRWRSELARMVATVFSALRRERLRLVSEVRLGHIEDALSRLAHARAWAGATAIKHAHTVRAFFRWCHRRGYCASDPAALYEAPRAWRKAAARGQYRGTALTVEQARILLLACRTPYERLVKPGNRAPYAVQVHPPGHLYVAVMLGLRAGLRLGNIVGRHAIRWRNLRDGMTVLDLAGSETKNDMRLLVPVHPELQATLLAWLRSRPETPYPDSPVLFAAAGQRSSIKRSWSHALQRAGLSWAINGLGERVSFRFHDLRHTFSTWLAAMAPEQVKRALLGHSPRGVSDRYTHLGVEELRPHLEALERLDQPAVELPAAEAEDV